MTKSAAQRDLRKAFAAGEQWGVCYSGWFNPSDEDTEREARRAIRKIQKERRRQLRAIARRLRKEAK